MPVFNPRFDWKSESDVRRDAIEHWADMIRGQNPRGSCWSLIAARRAGKTWALKGIEASLIKSTVDVAYIDLRQRDDVRFNENLTQRDVVLLDEPQLVGTEATARAAELVNVLKERARSGKKTFLAIVPSEWDVLRHADGVAIDQDDLLSLKPLSETQAKDLARKVNWAKQVVSSLPESWRLNPFVLEFALEYVEKLKERNQPFDLAHLKIIAREIDYEFGYIQKVFEEGLTESQREQLRHVARCDSAAAGNCVLLEKCGLVRREPHAEDAELIDPLLRLHLPQPLRIHHVSDLHVSDSTPEKSKQAQTGATVTGATSKALGDAAGYGAVINDYVNFVTTLPASQRPHLLIVSGDVVEHGTKEQYALVKPWFEKIETLLVRHEQLPDSAARVLVVGGNHDVNRSLMSPVQHDDQRHQPFADAFSNYSRPKLEEPAHNRNLAVEKYGEAKLEVVLLGSAELGQEFDDALTTFTDLLDKACLLGLAPADREKALEEARKELRIDPGLVHHQDLIRMKKLGPPATGTVRIAVLHHHVSPMPHFTDVGRFAGLLNAGQIKDACFASQVALILHGHMHSGWFAAESWPGSHRDWTIRIAAAPTLGSKELVEHHGFNEIAIYREGDNCEIEVRSFGREGQSWTEKRRMGPFTPGK